MFRYTESRKEAMDTLKIIIIISPHRAIIQGLENVEMLSY